jgi:hypothetical protein
MAIRCSYCGREYDVTLFEFGRSIVCVCGKELTMKHQEMMDENKYMIIKEEMNIRKIKRLADRIAFLIVATDYPDIDIEIEKQKLKDEISNLFPDKEYLYELIYEARFRRLKSQFREISD